MKNFIQLLEELNLAQRDYVDTELGGNEYKPEEHHTDMFDAYKSKNNRIILPYENTQTADKPLSNSKVDINIRSHLARNGWGVHDYRAGLASRNTLDRDGNPKREIKKIGKILQETGGDKVLHPEMNDRLIKIDGKPVIGEDGRMKSEKVPQSLLHFYNNDPSRSSKGSSSIVISRDKYDIAGMTSGRTWERNSCMRLPNSEFETHPNHQIIKEDLRKGTLIAYSTKNGDDDIEKPMGRVLIKPFTAQLKDGSKHTIYRTENHPYGDPPSDFVNQVESLMKKQYPIKEGSTYKLEDGLYNDSRGAIEPIKRGLYKNNNVINNYNENGELHDYVDEHGITQPAIHNLVSGNFTHYKNGLVHNENGASTIDNEDGGFTEYHYINGELHRDGDKPAIKLHLNGHKSVNNKIFKEEYHVGGLLHRDSDKPAKKYKTVDGYTTISYHRHGLEHRDNEGISESVVIPYHVNSYSRRTYGLLHTTTNKPSLFIADKNGIKKQWHRDDKLHRDDDKPASIEFEGYNNLITKKWYKNGELSRDDDSKPHTIKYNKDTKQILEKHWNRPYGSNKPIEESNRHGLKIKMFNRDQLKPYKTYTDDEGSISKHWLLNNDTNKTITLDDNRNLKDNINKINISENREHTMIQPLEERFQIKLHKDENGNYNKVTNAYGDVSPKKVKDILQKGMESPIPEISRFYKSHYDKLKHL